MPHSRRNTPTDPLVSPHMTLAGLSPTAAPTAVTPRTPLPTHAALDHLLSTVELRSAHAMRHHYAHTENLTLAACATTLIVVLEGSLRAPATLTSGYAFLSLGNEDHELEVTAGTTALIATLDLGDSALRNALPRQLHVADFATSERSAAALAATLGDPADAETCALRSGDPVICRMMITTLLLAVVRSWAHTACAPAGWAAPHSDPFLDRVLAEIHADPGRDWSLDLLAAVGAMSRTVFAERFRNTVGTSPASYVTHVRIDQAKRLLRTGHSVSETAATLGYGSDEGFRRAFRRHTGRTPSAWRGADLLP